MGLPPGNPELPSSIMVVHLSLEQVVGVQIPCGQLCVYCRVFGVGIRSLSLKQKVAGSIPAPAAKGLGGVPS